MDPEELAQLQLERLEATLSRVYRNVPYYRKTFDEIGFDPDELRSVDELRRLPFTTKADLNASYPYGLFAVPLRDVVRVHTSGGTGTAAIVMAYTRNDIKTWSNLNARMQVASGVTKDDVVQITFGYGLLTGAFGVHYGAERLGASVIPISSGNTKRQIKIMQDFKTTTLVATPTYALHLADTMLEMGVNPNALSLAHALLGGEPWSEETRERLEQQLNVRATDNYALSEVMGPGIAGECLEQAGLHVNEDAFLVEVVDPSTLQPVPRGKPGELVITTLTKEAFPLIRYRTRDLTAVLPEPCACGRTLLRIRRLEQRTDDMLIIRGVTVHPSSVEAVLRDIAGAERHQIVIERKHALDEATVVIGMSESVFFDEMKRQSEFRDKVRRRLASELGVSFEVKLVDRKTREGLAGKGKVVDLRKAEEGEGSR
jgi:phenylacetate-CoA ligase